MSDPVMILIIGVGAILLAFVWRELFFKKSNFTSSRTFTSVVESQTITQNKGRPRITFGDRTFEGPPGGSLNVTQKNGQLYINGRSMDKGLPKGVTMTVKEK